jgi:hypothetical protein
MVDPSSAAAHLLEDAQDIRTEQEQLGQQWDIEM